MNPSANNRFQRISDPRHASCGGKRRAGVRNPLKRDVGPAISDKIMMLHSRTLIGMAVAMTMIACTSTTRFAAEYKQQFHLAEDVNLYTCSTFTGFYSVWFSGPQRVETICSSAIPVAGAKVLKKGCPVRVLKLFKIAAVDASYSDAKLQIVDVDSKTNHIVYVKWPSFRVLLRAGPADQLK